MANPIKERLEAAAELDLRRQAQIRAQVDIINRLMQGENSYDEVLQALTETVARKQVENRELSLQVEMLKRTLAAMQAKETPTSKIKIA